MLFVFEVFGDTQIARDLTRFGDRVATPIPAWEEMLVAMKDSIQEQFDTQGAHGSGGWEPLAEATISSKERKGLRPEILRATDDLMNALTGETGTAHQIEELDPEGFTFGTDLPYAAYHQMGRGVPMRKPVEFPLSEREEFVKILQRYMIEGAVL